MRLLRKSGLGSLYILFLDSRREGGVAGQCAHAIFFFLSFSDVNINVDVDVIDSQSRREATLCYTHIMLVQRALVLPRAHPNPMPALASDLYLVLGQPQSPPDIPADHIAVDGRLGSLVLAVCVERLA